MGNSRFSIATKYGIFMIALYYCIMGLFGNQSPTNSETEVKTTNLSKSSNIVLMVIDSLRSDMVSAHGFASSWPRMHDTIEAGFALCSTTALAAPTVTSPRVKAIATGSIPEFIDLIYNLGGSGPGRNSWVQMLAKSGKRLELYGDNTWLRLFPGSFSRYDGTDSFFVSDFFEVDENVTRHLDSRVPAVKEWDFMILHYLGVDHIGHVQGPFGDSMPSKLREMDLITSRVINHLNSSGRDDWLFVLTGDHGMSNQGSHGGGSFEEVSTTTLFVSPKFKGHSAGACNRNSGHFEILTDQTDLATTFGLLTGVGIPSGSVGVPSERLIKTFWPKPHERYTIILQLIEHLRGLLKCPVSGCSESVLSRPGVSKLNTFHREVSDLVRLCASNPDPLPLECQEASPEFDRQSKYAVDSLRFYQSRIIQLNNSQHSLKTAIATCAIMVAISIWFLLPGVRDIFDLEEYLSMKPRHRQRTIAYNLLAIFTLVCLVVHLLTLGSSSLVEEEHQTWYFLATTALLALLLVLSPLARDTGSSNTGAVTVLQLLVVIVLDRFLLKLLNQTGAKWSHLPDLSDWLEDNTAVGWAGQGIAWSVVFLTRSLTVPPKGQFRRLHFRTMLSLLGVILTQVVYRLAVEAASANSNVHSSSSSSSSVFGSPIFTARLAYLALFLDFAACLWYHRRLSTWSHDVTSSIPSSSTGAPLLNASPLGLLSASTFILPSPVHTLGLLACLLSKAATSVILWAGVLLKEDLLARIFLAEFAELGASRSLARSKLTYFVAMLYWMQGWVTFYQQGNSNKFTTVDVTAGYVGLSSHYNSLSSVLVTVSTSAGPLFWHLSFYYRFLCGGGGASEVGENSGVMVGSSSGPLAANERRLHVRNCLAGFTVGLLLAGTTVSAVVCVLMINHLFIWSVFAPKLLYASAYCFVSIPLYVFLLIF